MSSHRFATGQRVHLKTKWRPGGTEAGVFLVTGMLPEQNRSPQYRIRNEAERHERVATEDSLEAIETPDSATAQSEDQRAGLLPA